MTDLWLPEFQKMTWDPWGFGYACAYFYKPNTTEPGTPWPMDKNPAGLAHTTETKGLPSYHNGTENPNFTIDPWTKTRYQHVPANVTARALMANNEKCVQIEIVAFCSWSAAVADGDEAYHISKMGDAERQYLAESLQIIGEALGIPPTSTLEWLAFPASGGINGVRLTADEMSAYVGWMGHEHAPTPDWHGDPGDLMPDILKRMVAIAASESVNPPPPAQPVTPKPAPNPKPTGAGLVVDGDFGPKTEAALLAALHASALHWAVGWMQVQLNLAHCYGLNSKPLAVDGLGFSSNSTADVGPFQTVAALQRHYGTPVDGVISKGDSAVIRALQEHLNLGRVL